MPTAYLLPSERPKPGRPPERHPKTIRPSPLDMPKVGPVPKDVAAAVMKRDGHKCIKCGYERSLEIDHILPRSRGGTNEKRNLQTLCHDCNTTKGGRLTAAALHRLHPELRLDDLEFVGPIFTTGRFDPPTVKWSDTFNPVRITTPMRSVLVPEEHHAEVMALLDRLRGGR